MLNYFTQGRIYS